MLRVLGFPLKHPKEMWEYLIYFFADDLILFAKVNNEVCEAISDALLVLCTESRQKVSVEKSRIYFSLNVDLDMKEIVCDRLGMRATSNFGKYLGLPLKHKGVPRSQFNFVAKRLTSKLLRWKAKFLSFAARAVLVKSVMSAIVRTYVFHMLRTYVMILCNWLIL